jgi:chaperonin cofactor prefoldin
MECLPIVQDDFPPDYKSVRDMLRTKIKDCNAVVHLAGFYYGAEPQPVFPGPDRRSFTQMEYEIAMELKLPCYVFLCGKDFPFDPHDPEPEEKQQLQLEHRGRLLKRDELFYEFATPEELANRTRELQLSVEGLRGELAKERFRRRLTLAASIVVFAVGGAYFYNRQQATDAVNVQQSSEIAALKAQLEGPWVIVSKVNAAMGVLADAGGPPAEVKAAAIAMVAEELKKSPDEIQKAIAATTQVAERLIAAARAEAERDVSKRSENLKVEIETLEKLAASHLAAAEFDEARKATARRLELIDPKAEPALWLDGLIALADVDEDLGKQKDAGDAYRKGMEFGESEPQLDVDHALTRRATDRYFSYLSFTENNPPEAEQLMRRVWELRKKTLGADHPATLDAMADLGEILAEQKKYGEAEPLVLEAWETAEKLYGEEDSRTMEIVLSAARVLQSMGKMETAIKLQRMVVAHRAKQSGKDSMAAETSAISLAAMLRADDQLEEAEKIYLDIHEARKNRLGEDHPDTLKLMDSYALIVVKKEDYAKAEKLYRRQWELYKAKLGHEHPSTLDNLNSIASQRWYQDDLAGAEKLFQEELVLRRRAQGEDHSSTVTVKWSLAAVKGQQGKYDGAEALQLEILDSRQKKLGAKAPEVAAAYADLAETKRSLGQTSKAVGYAKQAVAIAEEALPEDDEDRAGYVKLLASLATPATPSFEDFNDFRVKLNEQVKAGDLKVTKVDLKADPDCTHTLDGAWEGQDLRRIFEWDAQDDSSGTFTFFYYKEGTLKSVYRIREGTDSPVDGVKKATDTFNFVEGKLVSWKRTQDEAEKEEDVQTPEAQSKGSAVLQQAEAANAALRP